MEQIISFIRRSKYFFLFLVLQFIAFFLIVEKNYYHRNKFIHSTNNVTGFFAEKSNKWHDYFQLDSINKSLMNENATLRNDLLHYKNTVTLLDKNTNYNYLPATVIINNYLLQNNYITIDKGTNDGIAKDMAVIGNKGIVGVVVAVSANYAQVMSVLHQDFRVNAALKKNGHFGVLRWQGVDYNAVELLDIPKLADVKVNDTIVTGGNTVIFPKNVPIGIVKAIDLKPGNNYYNIKVALFQDMSNLNYVYIVKNKDKSEINTLLKTTP